MSDFKDLINFEYDDKKNILRATMTLTCEEMIPKDIVADNKEMIKDLIAQRMFKSLGETYLSECNKRCCYNISADGTTENAMGMGVITKTIYGNKYLFHPTRDVSDDWIVCSFRTMQHIQETMLTRCSYRLFECTDSLPFLNEKTKLITSK